MVVLESIEKKILWLSELVPNYICTLLVLQGYLRLTLPSWQSSCLNLPRVGIIVRCHCCICTLCTGETLKVLLVCASECHTGRWRLTVYSVKESGVCSVLPLLFYAKDRHQDLKHARQVLYK